MRFVAETQTGEPVDTGNPDRVAHRYTAPDGRKVVVVRDARGRLLPGAKLILLRVDDCSEPTTEYSAVRRALGIETKRAAYARRKREREGRE